MLILLIIIFYLYVVRVALEYIVNRPAGGSRAQCEHSSRVATCRYKTVSWRLWFSFGNFSRYSM